MLPDEGQSSMILNCRVATRDATADALDDNLSLFHLCGAACNMRCSRSAAAMLCELCSGSKHLSFAFHRRKVVQQGRLKSKLWLMMIFICNFQLVKITLMHLASLPITGLTKNRPWRIISDGRALAPRVQPRSSFADCSQGNNFMTLTSIVQAPTLEHLVADGRSCNAYR